MMHRLSPAPSRRRRAVQFIEFALIMPFFVVLIFFALDIGRMSIAYATMQDLATTTAIAGAQSGGVCLASDGTVDCNNGPGAKALSQSDEILAALPAGLVSNVAAAYPSGDKCTVDGANSYVTVTLKFDVQMLTPGLSLLAGTLSGHPGKTLTMTTTALSRCEIVRD